MKKERKTKREGRKKERKKDRQKEKKKERKKERKRKNYRLNSTEREQGKEGQQGATCGLSNECVTNRPTDQRTQPVS